MTATVICFVLINYMSKSNSKANIDYTTKNDTLSIFRIIEELIDSTSSDKAFNSWKPNVDAKTLGYKEYSVISPHDSAKAKTLDTTTNVVRSTTRMPKKSIPDLKNNTKANHGDWNANTFLLLYDVLHGDNKPSLRFGNIAKLLSMKSINLKTRHRKRAKEEFSLRAKKKNVLKAIKLGKYVSSPPKHNLSHATENTHTVTILASDLMDVSIS